MDFVHFYPSLRSGSRFARKERKNKKRKSASQISYPQFPFGELRLSLREEGKEASND